ncbi:hypothetical protein G9A89_015350 [Geosiphon pyriformis]|nr:hypothetical protein G9A89_015350 [Geosiphon pyriformis]
MTKKTKMPRGGLLEATLAKVAHHDYWGRAVYKWGHTDNWDTYYLQEHENATIEMLHQALNSDLEILVQNLKPFQCHVEQQF